MPRLKTHEIGSVANVANDPWRIDMRIAGGKESTIWEWIVLFSLLAAAEVITKISNLSHKWADAVVYTVVLFGIVTMALRPAWGRRVLWQSLLPLFAVHILAMTVVLQALPLGPLGFPKLLLIPAVVIEGLLMLAVLWNRTVRSKSGKDRPL